MRHGFAYARGVSYVKLHASLLNSTVWMESHATRIVWITMLAMADQDGQVMARAPGIARAAGVTRAECDEALIRLSSADPDSRTQDHEGRRIEENDEGWLLLNYEAHRDRQSAAEKAEKHAARQARYRARTLGKRDAKASTQERHVTPSDAALREVTRVTLSSHLISSHLNSSESEREQSTRANGQGVTWATVLHKLRAIHGSDRYDPSSYREALEWIAEKPEADRDRALKHYAADPWAMANPGHAHPRHIRAHWDKYLDGPMRIVLKPTPEAVGSTVSPEATAYRALCDARDAAAGADRVRLASEVRAMARAARKATGGQG